MKDKAEKLVKEWFYNNYHNCSETTYDALREIGTLSIVEAIGNAIKSISDQLALLKSLEIVCPEDLNDKISELEQILEQLKQM